MTSPDDSMLLNELRIKDESLTKKMSYKEWTTYYCGNDKVAEWKTTQLKRNSRGTEDFEQYSEEEKGDFFIPVPFVKQLLL
jgi:hypothetical protein